IQVGGGFRWSCHAYFFRQIIFQKIPVHKNLRRRSVPGGVGFVLKTPPTPSYSLISDCGNIP
ncbi:TPA: hypothetical protein ACHKSB_005523, partial [Escherichia coli]